MTDKAPAAVLHPHSGHPYSGSSRWQRAALVVNTRSRKGARLFQAARDQLAAVGVPLVLAVAQRQPARMAGDLRRALAAGADLLIVGGGDGSVSGAAATLRGQGCVFAPLPLGTANSFVRTLGMGTRVEDAVAAIAGGRTAMIDLCEINGHVFANSASLGLSPLIGDTIPPRLKRWLGRLGYLVWAARAMALFRPFRVGVEHAGERRDYWATEVRMLNGNHVGGVRLSEEARLDNGTITLQIVTGRSRWRLALDWYCRILWLPGWAGEYVSDVVEFQGTRFHIETWPKQDVSIDGEVLTRTPFDLVVHPRALEVVVPCDEP